MKKKWWLFEANNIESLAQKIEEWSNKILTTDRGLLRNECRKPILLKYNPKNQAQLIWECITKMLNKIKEIKYIYEVVRKIYTFF